MKAIDAEITEILKDKTLILPVKAFIIFNKQVDKQKLLNMADFKFLEENVKFNEAY